MGVNNILAQVALRAPMQTIRFPATLATNLSLGGMGCAAIRVYQATNRTMTGQRVHRVLGRPFLSLE